MENDEDLKEEYELKELYKMFKQHPFLNNIKYFSYNIAYSLNIF